MQYNKSYWWIIAGTCFAGALVAEACTVTTSSDVGTDGGIQAGGSAGAGTGGTATAGTGGSATAGAAGTGTAGTTGTPFQCDMGQGDPVGTPSDCTSLVSTDPCLTCIHDKCCTEYGQCYATSPGNQCGWGGPDSAPGESEFICYLNCMRSLVSDAGTADPTMCSGPCATQHDSSNNACLMGDIGSQTNALIGCMTDNNCNSACGIAP